MMMLAAITAGAKGKADWKGRVVDQNGEPVEYANVVVLSKADSSVVCGTVTAEDGSFDIETSETDGIMMVAMIGYRTIYLAPVNGAVITLLEDVNLLEGAVATAIMPKTKLTGGPADQRTRLSAGERGHGQRRAGQDSRRHTGPERTGGHRQRHPSGLYKRKEDDGHQRA